MKPDYDKWKTKELWTIYQGAWIVAGDNPPEGGDLFKAFENPSGNVAHEIYDHAKDAISKGKLKHYGSRTNQWTHVRVDPADFLTWLKQKGGYTIPSELSALATEKPLTPKERDNLKRIIGALNEFIAGDTPGKKRHPDFSTQSDLIEFLSTKYDFPGISKRNLETIFAAAKRLLSNT